MRKIQLVAALLFLVSVGASRESTAAGVSLACSVEGYTCWGNRVTFYGCEEDCGFNWDWCVNYCGGNPTNFDCYGVPPATSGYCECAPCME
ncbi:MAG: hypothetical protein AMXMBFR57_32420 [Acidimicrobiia bacterium]|jgi:hypothetical protein